MVKIGIIVGSTRPGRFGIQPAQWLKDFADQRGDAEYEIIDIADANLPLLDEPASPMMNQYSHDHTKAWSETIKGFDGYVFVTPEYNHSLPASLKNAIDYLFYEWHYKPAAFVSYGSAAGGARAIEHLRAISAEIKLFDIREQVLIHSYWNNLNDQGEYQFGDHENESAKAMLDQLVFWTEKIKPAREELNKLAT